MNLKLYCSLVGAVGFAYGYYNNYFDGLIENKQQLDLTRKITQQIKHLMMKICIKWSKQLKETLGPEQLNVLRQRKIINPLRNQLCQIYLGKEKFALEKYFITKQSYKQYLNKWKNDPIIKKNTSQIIQMMERAINALPPDFTINSEVRQLFSRDDLCNIFRQIVTLISKRITLKIHQKYIHQKGLDSKKDEYFNDAVRQVNVFQLKINFLKQSGFKQSWGCPNQVFVKYLQSEKLNDKQYQKKIFTYEKCYDKIIEDVWKNPKKITLARIDEFFEDVHDQIKIQEDLATFVQSSKPLSSQQKKQKQMCIICVQHEANMINTKCFHLAVCSNCSLRLNKQCPICRSTGGIYKKVFKP